MTIVLGILAAALFVLLILVLLKSERRAELLASRDEELTAAKQQAESDRLRYETETQRVRANAHQALASAQTLLDQERLELQRESERARQHYEAEAVRIHTEADAEIAKARQAAESLRRYEALRDAEAEVRRVLAEALNEATALREEARSLLEKSRVAAAEERSKASQKAKELYDQAEARLGQATRDAGRIVAEAEKRAEQIGGDAYAALRDKQLLEQAVKAIHNVVEGYGDRYIVPSRSVLDDLAADFGHTAAGEALRAAREQSRRMVEQGEAASCDYVEAHRRETAIRFAIDAFNGRVDAALSRVRHDNHGTLEQQIRDAYSLVNLNGSAFRDARILPAYLDARLTELRWAVVVQELRLQEREEQRRIREQIREEERARREYERAMRDAAKQEALLREAMQTAEQRVREATAEQKARYERELEELTLRLKEAEERSQRAISMAQQTKRGHVYIISNVGSFGEHVYKIGLTRRLEPLERIHELGDSSVPFDFDVHAMIFSEDAPALESRLHKHFLETQVNKVNYRKEFFRVDLQHVREEVQKLGIQAKWTMAAAAAEYRETLAIENAIRDDPAKREAWVNRQLELEPLALEAAEADDAPQ